MTDQRLFSRASAPSPTPDGGSSLLRGGTVGNARLTALSGLVIVVLLAAEGFTLLNIRALITPHAFIGLLLIPPTGLKLASVGYRFMSYYAGRVTYRTAGPPHIVPRVLAPFLVASVIVLFATGVILLVTPPTEGSSWLQVHRMTFFVWFLLMSADDASLAPRLSSSPCTRTSTTIRRS